MSESLSSRSSVPSLLRDISQDETDEIVIFDEEFEIEEEYQYGVGLDDDLPNGYSLTELEKKVTFVNSSRDPKTWDFVREKKTLLWCIEHGCEEAQPGVWAGLWYFTYLFGEKEGRRTWVETMNRRIVKEGGGRGLQVDEDDYCAMLHLKEKGNRAFYRGQYNKALTCYLKAEKLMGGSISGMYLVPHQRGDLVVVLSNQAECYLRLRKYEDTILQASKALQLDKYHKKSLLRRAKAIVLATQKLGPLSFDPVLKASASNDLETIIGLDGDGVKEAKSLLSTMGGSSLGQLVQ